MPKKRKSPTDFVREGREQASEDEKRYGSKCEFCGQHQLKAASCTATHILLDNKVYKRVITDADFNKQTPDPYLTGERCHDCGVIMLEGDIHHYGCSVERCPKCGLQLIACACRKQALKIKRTSFSL